MSAAPIAKPARPAPPDAVLDWWRAMETGNVDALARVTLDDYLSAGGPGGRTIGREALLEGATEFFAAATIDEWQIDDLEVRDHGRVAVCSYRWSERGSHNGRTFAFAGVATDVLVLRGARWLYQAHHVSLAPDGQPA